jgi:hypothetical protein
MGFRRPLRVPLAKDAASVLLRALQRGIFILVVGYHTLHPLDLAILGSDGQQGAASETLDLPVIVVVVVAEIHRVAT